MSEAVKQAIQQKKKTLVVGSSDAAIELLRVKPAHSTWARQSMRPVAWTAKDLCGK